MDLAKVIAVAKSMEMAQQEFKFIKSNTPQQSTHEHTLTTGRVPHNSKCKAIIQTATDKVDIQHLKSFANRSIILDKVDATPSSSKSLDRSYPSISLQIRLNGQLTTMKIDNGAGANIITEQIFNSLQP